MCVCSDHRPDGPYLWWVSVEGPGSTRRQLPGPHGTRFSTGGATDSQGTPLGDPSLDLIPSFSVPRVSVNPVRPPTGPTLPWKSATPGRQHGPPHGHRSRQTRPDTSPHARASRSGQERESRAGFQAEVICHVTFLDMQHTAAQRYSQTRASRQAGHTKA